MFRPLSDPAPERIAELRREVREWMCDGCNTVYPGPPQPGIWCVQCPRCGGDTAPRDTIERRRLEREVERLRRKLEVLAAALNHVFTCENCECASCPEGTGLFYRAYKVLGAAQRAGSAS